MYNRFGDSTVAHIILGALLFFIGGCASAGDGTNLGGGDALANAGVGAPPSGLSLLQFDLAVNPNGRIDQAGRGVYAILLNAQGTPIEVTALDTFTDFIRIDGQNIEWHHRIAEVANAGFTFVQIGPLSGRSIISPDGRSIQVILDLADANDFINQFIPASVFTAHAVTTDTEGGAFLGRVLDTQGQGPNIDSNSLQTITVRRGDGAIQPIPQSYPFDALNDNVVHSDLGGDFPYENFDIVRFEVTAR